MFILLGKSSRHAFLLLTCLLLLSGRISAQNTIQGRVTLTDGITPLVGVAIGITGTENAIVLTGPNGEYSFPATPGGSYLIRPISRTAITPNPLEGITTFDLLILTHHASGIDTIPSPYNVIAGDVDDSQSLNQQDSIIISNLILGIFNDYQDNIHWNFVRADYVFPDPIHPFPYPSSATIHNFSSSQNHINFFGIRRADANQSAVIFNPIFATQGLHFSHIMGNATFDEDSDCTNDPGESPLGDWMVLATGQAGQFVTNTKADGSYNLSVPNGDFTVQLVPKNNLWAVCAPPQLVHVDVLDSTEVSFSAQPDKLCPRLEVDIAATLMRRCFTGRYEVNYCNTGTVPSENAFVEINLDPYLNYQASSIPATAGANNLYTFQLGTLAPGACGNFSVTFEVDCTVPLGHTHCSSAHIFPDSICGPVNLGWDGANLRVSGSCNDNQVEFTVTNEGDDMSQPAQYVIIEDIMIQVNGQQLQLAHGQSEVVTVEANGSTWRMEIDQPENHPWSMLASAAVEGCGTGTSGTVSQGYVNVFPQDDSSPFIDEDCSENTGSYDPNDKQGFPKGISNEHFIPKGEELEYLIRFQNTGTDTAFTVMVMDTISVLFDIKTLHAGPSSHPYTFNLLESGVAQFVFSNIMLPDSNVNEAASHGFVKFTISPKADLPDGTKLENQAGIYFDFNEPVITNRTLHTLGEPEQYLEVSQVKNLQSDVDLFVFPNPSSTEATFSIKSAKSLAGDLILYNFQGREVKRVAFSDNLFKINTAQLSSGTYMFVIQSGGNRLASGKLLVKND